MKKLTRIKAGLYHFSEVIDGKKCIFEIEKYKNYDNKIQWRLSEIVNDEKINNFTTNTLKEMREYIK